MSKNGQERIKEVVSSIRDHRKEYYSIFFNDLHKKESPKNQPVHIQHLYKISTDMMNELVSHLWLVLENRLAGNKNGDLTKDIEKAQATIDQVISEEQMLINTEIESEIRKKGFNSAKHVALEKSNFTHACNLLKSRYLDTLASFASRKREDVEYKGRLDEMAKRSDQHAAGLRKQMEILERQVKVLESHRHSTTGLFWAVLFCAVFTAMLAVVTFWNTNVSNKNMRMTTEYMTNSHDLILNSNMMLDAVLAPRVDMFIQDTPLRDKLVIKNRGPVELNSGTLTLKFRVFRKKFFNGEFKLAKLHEEKRILNLAAMRRPADVIETGESREIPLMGYYPDIIRMRKLIKEETNGRGILIMSVHAEYQKKNSKQPFDFIKHFIVDREVVEKRKRKIADYVYRDIEEFSEDNLYTADNDVTELAINYFARHEK